MTTQNFFEVVSRGGRSGTVRSPDLALDRHLGHPELAVHPAPVLTPELLFAGAYSACFHQAILNTAIGHGIRLAESTVRARVTLVETGKAGHRLSVDLYAVLPGIDVSQASRLMNEAHEICPYSKALRGDAIVTLSSN